MTMTELDDPADLTAALRATFTPPPHVTCLEFARTEYRLPDTAAAKGGAFVPLDWQEVFFGAVDDPAVHTIAIMASAQSGKSEAALCATGWAALYRPGPMGVYHATDDQAASYAHDRVTPALLATPATAKALMGRRSGAGQTFDRKVFTTGTVLTVMGATKQNLASRPLSWITATELRGMKSSIGDQGSPIAMMKARGRSFKRFFKAIFESSPTVANDLIHTEFAAGTAERWNLTCPHCGHEGPASLLPAVDAFHVHFTLAHPEDAAFACPDCGGLMSQEQRLAAIRGGRFVPTNPKPASGVRSFHVCELVVPSSSLQSIVERYLTARKAPHTLQAFYNLVLGEPYEPEARTVNVDVADLLARCETYRAAVRLPEDVLQITAGIDTQGNRLEVTVLGHGENGEAWLLEYAVITGSSPEFDGPIWRNLEAFLLKTYQHPLGGELRIETAFIDSGGTGGATQQVYLWSARHQAQGRRWIATKGKEGDRQAVTLSKSLIAPGTGSSVALRIVGVDPIKADIFTRLEITEPGPGFIHFPDAGLPEKYFEGLALSEKAVIKDHTPGGEPIIRYVKTGVARNEPLDTAVLAFAAASLFQLDADQRRADLTINQREQEAKPDFSRMKALFAQINA
jgi:phage terminase large subunit GpA-like protein